MQAAKFVSENYPANSSLAVSALPPNLVQAHGPVNLVLERADSQFEREQKAWLGTLADFFDVYLPDSEDMSQPQRLVLRPNATVFLQTDTLVDRMFSILLKPNEASIMEGSRVLSNLEAYGLVIQMWPSHILEWVSVAP